MREGPLSPVPLYFSSLSLLCTALHYLNAWNRLEGTLNSSIAEIVDWAMLITGKRLPSKINEEMTLTIKGTELELVPSAKLLS